MQHITERLSFSNDRHTPAQKNNSDKNKRKSTQHKKMKAAEKDELGLTEKDLRKLESVCSHCMILSNIMEFKLYWDGLKKGLLANNLFRLLDYLDNQDKYSLQHLSNTESKILVRVLQATIGSRFDELFENYRVGIISPQVETCKVFFDLKKLYQDAKLVKSKKWQFQIQESVNELNIVNDENGNEEGVRNYIAIYKNIKNQAIADKLEYEFNERDVIKLCYQNLRQQSNYKARLVRWEKRHGLGAENAYLYFCKLEEIEFMLLRELPLLSNSNSGVESPHY
ncbi:unnamed protein product [Ambrosiozyma monospora]|uniref:Unnamed protein product n=1 Tax=Ambrosiozyma monospora TaxID=43982 RepID=A0A9W7DHH5_AMBMO|nr:unnamed protein product [Ambrosiozyma monospora]